MRVMVIGGTGMAGHMIIDYLRSVEKYEVLEATRTPTDRDGCIYMEIGDSTHIRQVLQEYKPGVVVNATGILNQRAADNLTEAIRVNSVFPHQLALWGEEFAFRLVHLSTDCVFSGMRGRYAERDLPDGKSIYSLTKQVGEVTATPHVTIRTSIIGPELKEDGIGLFHWLMKQSGDISGYQKVYWSGVTTLELARAIEWILESTLSGLVHLTQEKISKHDLITLIKETFNVNHVHIHPTQSPCLDRSLINTRSDFSFSPLPYSQMIAHLKDWMDHSLRRYPYETK
ncbi:SDR family oxidoreductase [Mechercharimyces sp. CAU 1602]|uniref:dTDP-4-dehydrorhamnose reductase family protein n=1 Tax=Mechercharimyces sp. CAU 1602 TaxID=2973933 RepID=UPI002162B0AD|nr:SDR family oxidoreductase [Mechercharimyces sp. CAU 1602]MCS1350160.1 SDR family oxidoreductase [Mechercharimyces sp. CAU 1602]